MADFVFKISPNIILGPYVSTRLGQYAKEYGSRFMVVMDPVLKNSEIRTNVLKYLDDQEIKYFIFDSITDGANTKDISQALSIAREAYIQGIISVGSLKTLNIAMAVSSLVNESFTVHDYVDGYVPKNNPVPVICVPTTFRFPLAFSSQITLTDSRSSRVKVVPTKKDVCRLVLADTNFIKSLPEKIKAPMIMELLCMACEAYISPKSNFFSDMFVEKSLELMRKVFNPISDGLQSVPEEVLLSEAGCMISLAVSFSSPGLAALLALAIHSRYRQNVSVVSSIFFPKVIEDGMKFSAEKIARLAGILKITENMEDYSAAGNSLLEFAKKYRMENGIPGLLTQLNLTAEHLAPVCQDAAGLELVNSLPQSMSSENLFEVLREYL